MSPSESRSIVYTDNGSSAPWSVYAIDLDSNGDIGVLCLSHKQFKGTVHG